MLFRSVKTCHRIAPSSSYRGLRVADNTGGVCHLHGLRFVGLVLMRKTSVVSSRELHASVHHSTGLMMLIMGVILASSAPPSSMARWRHLRAPCLRPLWHRLGEEDDGASSGRAPCRHPSRHHLDEVDADNIPQGPRHHLLRHRLDGSGCEIGRAHV